jgi:hypothetical protein
MRFDLREVSGYFPELEYGDQGNELSCFIPDKISWKQVNYGQGEGQARIESCEWGFYYGDDDSLSIVLHSGSILLDEALIFVNKVCHKVFGDRSSGVVVSLTGTD